MSAVLNAVKRTGGTLGGETEVIVVLPVARPAVTDISYLTAEERHMIVLVRESYDVTRQFWGHPTGGSRCLKHRNKAELRFAS